MFVILDIYIFIYLFIITSDDSQTYSYTNSKYTQLYRNKKHQKNRNMYGFFVNLDFFLVILDISRVVNETYS